VTEPPRRRVPVAAEQSVREERRGFFRWAAILGVIVGIPLGVLGIPPLLNVFFDEPTVPVNGAYSEDGLTVWVESQRYDDAPPRALTVILAVRITEGAPGWSLDLAAVELELSDGDPIPPAHVQSPAIIEYNRLARFTLHFELADADEDAEPVAVRLAEPKVRFALTEEDH